MAKIVKRRWTSGPGVFGTNCYHWCPACDQVHAIRVEGPPPNWEWNGELDNATFSPSVLNFTTHDDDGALLPNGERRTLCHYFVKNGNIEYCGDNPHALNGKTVPLPEFPPGWFGSETQD